MPWRMTTWVVAGLVVGACQPDLGAHSQPVIGGSPTPAGLYPATGALLLSTDGPELVPYCTGTLIARDAVLTAAHCLDPLFIGEDSIHFTLAHDATAVTRDQVVPAQSYFAHPSFSVDEDAEGIGRWYDIGVLILDGDFAGVAVEVLPNPDEAAALAVDDLVEIVGYGMATIDSEEIGVKHHGSAHLTELGEWELLVARTGEQQNCYGDSGGPALVDLGDGRRLVGVVSRSPDDEPVCDHGGVDTRVDAYLEWIHSLAQVPCGGLLTPCRELDDGGDCSCTTSASTAPVPLPLLGLGLVALWARRRRRR